MSEYVYVHLKFTAFRFERKSCQNKSISQNDLTYLNIAAVSSSFHDR